MRFGASRLPSTSADQAMVTRGSSAQCLLSSPELGFGVGSGEPPSNLAKVSSSKTRGFAATDATVDRSGQGSPSRGFDAGAANVLCVGFRSAGPDARASHVCTAVHTPKLELPGRCDRGGGTIAAVDWPEATAWSRALAWDASNTDVR